MTQPKEECRFDQSQARETAESFASSLVTCEPRSLQEPGSLHCCCRVLLQLLAGAVALWSSTSEAFGCKQPPDPFATADCVVVAKELLSFPLDDREVVVLRVDRAAKGCWSPILPVLTGKVPNRGLPILGGPALVYLSRAGISYETSPCSGNVGIRSFEQYQTDTRFTNVWVVFTPVVCGLMLLAVVLVRLLRRGDVAGKRVR